ncbi:PKD domain-containing protein [Chryseotalea sanaruensis]|uniref:PKD domain-containing protein n=1 Tax=Chryseotalea sanaruensis TaxID=2482724 RepID=A0A401UDR2_9BACT|nr:FG-GAP-like repeat-containing protein [Chryseotalea sanaruensis]GCC53029.1 PKD domain-containing protein [Chryseotalea sanaruensis]
MRIFFIYNFIVLVFATSAYAQIPVISSVEPGQDFPGNTVIITGSGFGNNAASLRVFFDHVQGAIVSASDVAIEVTVPPQARYENIEVINVTTRLSAKSRLKFLPSFNGAAFDPSKFQSQIISSNTVPVFDMCSCDLDGDGKPDLAGTKNVAGTDLIILHNKSTIGTPAFDRYDKTNLPALDINQSTENIACGDLNGDGKPDLIASRGGASANSFYIFRNTSAATPAFAAPIEVFLNAGQTLRQIEIRDLNGDGKPELIIANSANSGFLYVIENQSSGGNIVFNTANPIQVPVVGAPNTLALEVQDFDNDGRPDIIASQNQGSNLFFIKNLSGTSLSFAPATTVHLLGTFNDISSGDFNKDGKLDIAVTSVFGTQSFVLLNKSEAGSTPFPSTVSVPAESITLITAGGPFGVEIEDLNGDGFPDVIINNRGNTNISIFLHNKNLTTPGFTTAPINAGKNGWFSRVGDFDGDAKPDIVFTQAVTTGPNTITILRNSNCHQPFITNVAPIKICPGQTVTLEAIKLPGITYEWKKDGVNFKGPGADAFADVTLAGSYTVEAIGEAAACALTSVAFVVESGSGSIPTDASINPITSACPGADLTITAVSQIGASYLWTGPNGFTSETAVPQLVIPDVDASNAGIYTLKLKIGDCIGEEDTEQAAIVDVGNVNIGSNVTGQVCEGSPVTLNVNALAGRTYQWIKDGADIGGQTSTTLDVTQAGVYKLRVTFSGCTEETDDFPVSFFTQPVADFTAPVSICINEVINFINNSTVDNTATVEFAWDFGDGNTSTEQSPTHTYTSVPTQNPSLSISYAGVASCTSTIDKIIAVNAPIQPEITSDVAEICPGDEAVLRVNDGFSSITWSNGEITQEITITEPALLFVTTIDANGCEGSGSLEITQVADCSEPEIIIPNMFSPNGDNQNDNWIVAGIEGISDCEMKVFDERGMRVYEKKGFEPTGWDGTFNGKIVPSGTYYYVFTCPGRKAMTGSVLIVK